MSLVELIAQADERGLAASGLACLDRCIPLLDGDDEVLRPLWASLADGSDWAAVLDKARGALDTAPSDADEAVLLARRMLEAAPAERTADAVRAWADACSVASLRIHRLLDPAVDDTESADGLGARRTGGTEGVSPLVAAELRRQVVVLELLAEHGKHGLRRALDITVEGRRVLRAVVSRRARGRG
ncbi:hypothetical protein J2Z21_002381 [Streptomyces griseochromogenes]|uniref:Uncharacterized protein n=1 Tax=Streptomyces griseochromogenes TaxID=68214 RepID=A0A1B1AR52_9ACTN|nr:hypothetical protein [Streptomyces griseochromogenes]ANP49035.1 hypothetical protein AVL59_05080 [Streptomyces griseochromogenes]MBP2049450.1 hypothetical protein [Streptomyces griseochromogenes]